MKVTLPLIVHFSVRNTDKPHQTLTCPQTVHTATPAPLAGRGAFSWWTLPQAGLRTARRCHHTWSLCLCSSADTSSQPRQHGPGQRTPLAAPGAPCVPRAIAGSPPSHQRRRTPWLLSRQSEEGEPGGALSRPRKEQGTRAPCLPPPEPGSLCLAASVQAGEAEQAVPGRRGLACMY